MPCNRFNRVLATRSKIPVVAPVKAGIYYCTGAQVPPAARKLPGFPPELNHFRAWKQLHATNQSHAKMNGNLKTDLHVPIRCALVGSKPMSNLPCEVFESRMTASQNGWFNEIWQPPAL